MLFAISVAGVTGYMVIGNEFDLADQNAMGYKALAVARGGLERFLAEQIGEVGDSVAYAIGDGIATLTSRKVVEEDSLNHIYFIRSEGTVTDARYPGNPARRVVGAYAYRRISPVNHVAAIMSTGDRLDFRYWARADGYDQATTSDCAGGGTAGVAGAIAAERVRARNGSVVQGNPNSATLGSYQAIYDTAGVRWDILSDPDFPVEFDGSPPNFGALPPDSFPVVRYVGNLNAGSSWSGRGVLIVTGRLRMYSGFSWNGIILAGELRSTSFQWPVVDGTVIGGLNVKNPNITYSWGGLFRYHSCNVYAADRSLSYLEPISNTTWEEY